MKTRELLKLRCNNCKYIYMDVISEYSYGVICSLRNIKISINDYICRNFEKDKGNL